MTPTEIDDVRPALERQWLRIEWAVPSLDLDMPSRIAGWRNREVLAHLALQPTLVVRFLATASTQAPEVSLTGNLGGTRSLAGMIDAAARKAADGGQIDFSSGVRAALPVLTEADITRTVTTVQGPILLADYLVTRCIEAVVHGQDFIAAVEPDSEALEISARALTALLAERDATLLPRVEQLSHTTWINVATGREPAPPGLAGVLPLTG
ncbi:MAG: maleylpyruvate isomerase N-terminal domain-containing protein [Acidimicrobiia bacterium]